MVTSPAVKPWARNSLVTYDEKGMPWSLMTHEQIIGSETDIDRHDFNEWLRESARKMLRERIEAYELSGAMTWLCAAVVLRRRGIDAALEFVERVARDQAASDRLLAYR